MKANKIIRSLGVGIMGIAMLAASSLPALAVSRDGGDLPTRTTVSGSIGSLGGGTQVRVGCWHYGNYTQKNTNANLQGQYAVSFAVGECNNGDTVAAATSGIVSGSYVQVCYYSGYNTGYISGQRATVNIQLHLDGCTVR